jgi:hypothetical protein
MVNTSHTTLTAIYSSLSNFCNSINNKLIHVKIPPSRPPYCLVAIDILHVLLLVLWPVYGMVALTTANRNCYIPSTRVIYMTTPSIAPLPFANIVYPSSVFELPRSTRYSSHAKNSFFTSTSQTI